MDCRECGRKRSWASLSTVSKVVWKDWRTTKKLSVAGPRVIIRTQDFPNAKSGNHSTATFGRMCMCIYVRFNYKQDN
jgi:hypothetical protein